MDFRSLKVKELMGDPKLVAVLKEEVPALMQYPIKLFNSKSCGEIFDLVVKKKIVPADQAKKVEERINELLK
ncbi:MAG: hypothetical protein VB039_03280 [Oscillospiraceae bacterium]|nr:hypothetical protein [Oscillospiraceae bacterium]